MEEKITLYMKNLGLTREEAVALIADDENDVSVELTADQKKAVKEMSQADHKPHGNHRKPDTDKREIMQVLDDAMCDFADNVIVVNPEREIQIEYNGALYRIILSKPRGNK